ncbi:MAG: hypothetical protein JNK30_22785 [Phenylobacterium sp.]|uniref:hypothetical protein n=1 Tax=Phenylobacterium sp. TaxID=1871053 RepID=UPI001A45EEA3|nr:hypothetical protein [Phenylobacterium sp.]MBL8774233.1 hypothetical protein [Phenylobacterium sp.]
MMKSLLAAVGGCAVLAAGPALAQLPATPSATGAPSSVTVPAQPAGQVVQRGGQAVIVGAGAHGGGPAPVVAGAVPQTRPFTEGVTDGGAKVGKGMKSTGGAIERGGVTVSPQGAKKGAEGVPRGLETQVNRAAAIPR